jgi:hypothetical protein
MCPESSQATHAHRFSIRRCLAVWPSTPHALHLACNSWRRFWIRFAVRTSHVSSCSHPRRGNIQSQTLILAKCITEVCNGRKNMSVFCEVLALVLTTQHPLSAKVGANFADKRRSLGQYSSLADYDQGVCFVCWNRQRGADLSNV